MSGPVSGRNDRSGAMRRLSSAALNEVDDQVCLLRELRRPAAKAEPGAHRAAAERSGAALITTLAQFGNAAADGRFLSPPAASPSASRCLPATR